ncbi:MAG: methyl-accepting chemotaxis protein [Hydrogenophilaceae bacterium]|nr:methyl-accepting chemotaxis protein [Hydrogenophilaceae bacterium]
MRIARFQNISDIRLRTKILAIFGVFLLGMVAIVAAAGYALINQLRTIEASVQKASLRVAASTQSQIAILEMDRAIQALIAADDPQLIRQAAIASIRAGTVVDENLAKLHEFFSQNTDVDRLITLMSEIRPKQMQVIGTARGNDDPAALQMAESIAPAFNEIVAQTKKIVEHSRTSLDNDLATAKKDAMRVDLLLGGFTVVGLILGLLLALAAARMLSAPLNNIMQVMGALAQGDLTRQVDVARAGRDEIGQTLKAIHETVLRLRELMRRVSHSAEHVAKGSGAVSQTAVEVDVVVEKLNHSIQHIQQQTETLKHYSDQVTQHLSEANNLAGTATETAVASTGQILNTVQNFERFQSEMEATSGKSRQLAEIAERITSITQTISGIAEMTNLLALNAAIEAARAGEHGRGFAVVADEVRKLAGQTSSAVDEISTLVSDIRSKVNDTVASMERVADSASQNIGELREAANHTKNSSERMQSTNQAMRQIVDLVAAQDGATANIALAADQLVDISKHNRTQSEELRNRSTNLGGAAEELTSVVGEFSV